MATKPQTRALRGAKTRFVSQHMTKPAGDIVALARKQGVTLTVATVHSIRSQLRKQGYGPQTEAVHTAILRRAGRVPPPPSDKRALLRRLIVEIGYDAAHAEFQTIAQSMRSMR